MMSKARKSSAKYPVARTPEKKLPPRMPYSSVVGQTQLKRALELCFVEPRIGGALLSGERGTGKTTTVRAFSRMALDSLVDLPINATEDRVVGGWRISDLVAGKAAFQRGLLEEADGGLLFVDEVNLLDDHIVNIILDVTSTGVLVVQREGLDRTRNIRFVLVGTMNPEEGTLRPQLLDRFGLMVHVQAEADPRTRMQILEQVLGLEDKARQAEAARKDEARRTLLQRAQARLPGVTLPPNFASACVRIAQQLQVEGHRGELVMAWASRALAAIEGRDTVTAEDLQAVAPLALAHRRKLSTQREMVPWSEADDALVGKVLADAPAVA